MHLLYIYIYTYYICITFQHVCIQYLIFVWSSHLDRYVIFPPVNNILSFFLDLGPSV